MFDLITILTLLAPAVLAPIVCLIALKVLARSERGHAPAPQSVAAFTRPAADAALPVAEHQAA